MTKSCDRIQADFEHSTVRPVGFEFEHLVVFSLEPWDTIWRRNQYLVDGLLRRNDELKVVFVEPARDPIYDVVRSTRPRPGAGLRTAAGYDGRLALLQPTKILPRLGSRLSDAVLRLQLISALRRTGIQHGVLWINDPGWSHVFETLAWPSLYDITDDWLLADRAPRHHRRLLSDENELMRRCTRIVVCSDDLLTSRSQMRPDAIPVPNAVDTERYRSPTPRPKDLPHGPVAVYVGTLHEDRLDVHLVARTAEMLAQVGGSCVLVGPNALSPSSIGLLRAARGLRVLGPRDFRSIPAYLQHADALIVPHRENAFTDSLDPIKLYEYRAVGRPIVSTPVARFRDLRGEQGVTIVGPEDFATAVALVTTRPTARSPLTDVPDWSTRVQSMEKLILVLQNAEQKR